MPSLKEDWIARQAQLQKCDNDFAQAQNKVFTYLLKRYGDQELIQKEARFPLNKECHWNHRAILVHQHLGAHQVSGIKTKEEAHARVEKLLKKIQRLDPSTDLKTPGSATPFLEGIRFENKSSPANKDYRPSVRQVRLWKRIDKRIRYGRDPRFLIWKALQLGPALKRIAVDYLKAQIINPEIEDRCAVRFLLRCKHPNGLLNYMDAYDQRIAQMGQTAPGTHCWSHRFMLREPLREQLAEKFRERLAHSDPNIRMAALERLMLLGTLEDVGLLSDLIQLPHQEDERADEKERILATMKVLSGNA